MRWLRNLFPRPQYVVVFADMAGERRTEGPFDDRRDAEEHASTITCAWVERVKGGR